MTCNVCGCENEEKIPQCSECGTDLTPPVAAVFCRHCGKQIRPTAKYCVYCGGKQAEEPAPEDPELPSDTVVAEEPAPVEEPTVEAVAEEAPASEVVDAPGTEPAVIHVPVADTVCAPAYQLPTRRGFWKMVLLGIITVFLYPLVILSRISVEINMVASRHDGKRTMHFLWMPIVGVLTLGVYVFVWFHKLCSRIGNELQRRHISYGFGAGSFWLWNFLWGILGSLVTAVLTAVLMQMGLVGQELAIVIASAGGILSSIGPFVFTHKLMRAMNLMNADYNENG